jgi:hypothetical protein
MIHNLGFIGFHIRRVDFATNHRQHNLSKYCLI